MASNPITPAAADLKPLIDRIQTAAAAKTPLRFRGGGSKDFYGQELVGDILDTTTYPSLQGISSYEPSELVVTVKAGTSLAELESVLAEKNQCLPFEPPHFGQTWGGETIMPHFARSQATVGGMVAAGLSGPARASSGALRDYVLGVDIINGKGEALHFGGTVMKNVAGYDVSRLMAGSMGTLGLITEVSLKVLPIAPAEATLKFACSQQEAITLLNTWGGKPLPLNASCWVKESGSEQGKGVLYVRLRGAVAAVNAAINSMGGELQNAASGNATVAADWQALRNQTLPFFELNEGESLWRLSVPDTTPDLQLDAYGETLVEWHGALRWVKLSAEAAAKNPMVLREFTTRVGGSATLFIASQAMNTPTIARFNQLSEPLQRIHRQLKLEFDPAGIFNPSRMFADI
ncbi:MAG TPA: glycolate oxidase subunit GlcE [Burkholderiaceae bacterium]|nr:glycolate oxidase subunit GlcE [Burkholderiaceae bacterium]